MAAPSFVQGDGSNPEPKSYRKTYNFDFVPGRGRTLFGGASRSEVIDLFRQGSKTYCPRAVPCEVTEYTFVGNHGERWPSTRITIGSTPRHVWEAINPVDDGKDQLFRVNKETVATTEGRSFNDLLSSVKRPTSVDQFFDAVDLHKADVRKVDGIQEDGTVVRTTVTATLGKKEIGDVEVAMCGNYAYLKVPKTFLGCTIGVNYFEMDVIDFGTFFQPKDSNNAFNLPKDEYGFPVPVLSGKRHQPKFDVCHYS